MEQDQQQDEPSAALAGAYPSVVRHFSIQGLYGYRSLALDSEYAATILIAKNGSGKTTLLGALDAFLQGQFTRFSGLEFSVISCRLRGIEEELTLSSVAIERLAKLAESPDVTSLAKVYEVDPLSLVDFVFSDFPGMSDGELYSHPLFYKIYLKAGYNLDKAKGAARIVHALFASTVPELQTFRAVLKNALKDYEVVYLPTFRRVELSLPDPEESRPHGPRKLGLLARLGVAKRGLYAGDVQFGLADISDRLSRLNQQMIFESHQGYQEISANIINDLITGVFENDAPPLEERPSKEALALFFERIKEGRSHYDSYNRPSVPNLDLVYQGNVPGSSAKFLDYFLGKLNLVMKKTQGVEQLVEEFISNCNRYLSADDPSTRPILATYDRQGVDDKLLKLDRRNLQVSVFSIATGRKVPLDALSSGEKQMISLFARLFLYPGKKKIVLIDEPELSLSLDWQRKILVDIISAPSCAQVVAITHSPFVFDNDLDEFATSLKLDLDLSAMPAIDEEDDV